jgi:hypothetical protein
MVATSFSRPPVCAKRSPAQTVTLRPARTTRARAAKLSPAAGESRLSLNSIESTSAPAGASESAA